MRYAGLRGIAGVIVFLLVVAAGAAAQAGVQSNAATAAAAAAKASPELIGALSTELAATPEQAAGAAGALFDLAKSRLKPGDFSQVSKAVPGMDLLLKAAPASAAVGGAPAALAQLAGTAARLPAAASAFSKLGLKPDLVAKAVPVLVSYVTKTGGANVGGLLAGALK